MSLRGGERRWLRQIVRPCFSAVEAKVVVTEIQARERFSIAHSQSLLLILRLEDSTEIYTRVSIQKLKDVHSATHPGAQLKPVKSAAKADRESDEEVASAILDAIVEEADDDPEA